MIAYFVTNQDGYIIKKGRGSASSLEAKVLEDGETLHIGSANADTQRIVDGVLVDLPQPLSVSPERIALDIRLRRDALLVQTDWTQVSDCPLPVEVIADFKQYRQQLRDLPSVSSGVTSIDDVVFPTPPTTS